VRSLEYWSRMGITVQVADSSKNEYGVNLPSNNIEYFHYPGYSYCEKLHDVLGKIKTEYAVLCADDDFITPIGLERSVDFLEKNPDYVIAHGKYILFVEQQKLSNNIIWRFTYSSKSFEQESASLRLFDHLSNYSRLDSVPTFYAVHRTEILQSIWESSAKYTNDGRFGELLPTMLSIIYGKIKVLDIFYSAREYNENSGSHISNRITDFIKDGSYNSKYIRFKECLSKELVSKEDISREKAQKLIDKAMNNYLGFSISKLKFKASVKMIIENNTLLDKFYLAYKKLRTSKKQKSVLDRLSPIEYDNPKNPFYPDFIRIKEAIENSIIKNR